MYGTLMGLGSALCDLDLCIDLGDECVEDAQALGDDGVDVGLADLLPARAGSCTGSGYFIFL